MKPVQHPMYINGQFVENSSDSWIDVINPATEELLSRIPEGTSEDAKRAIDAAAAVQPSWEALPAIERGRWLKRIADGIRENLLSIAGAEKYCFVSQAVS